MVSGQALLFRAGADGEPQWIGGQHAPDSSVGQGGTAIRVGDGGRNFRLAFQGHGSGADKGYDSREFVRELRDHQTTPHIAHKPTSLIDDRTTRHPGYAIKRKRVEEIFGWLKTVATLRKTRHRGLARVGWMFTFATAAYNLVRMRNLALAAP